MGPPAVPPAGQSPTQVRFGVLGFACSLSLLTYLDRICIMRVKPNIEQELALSAVQIGMVFSAFSVGYGLFEVPGGWMGDAWGSRRVLTRIVLWWSLFTALTGCVWQFTLDSGWSLGLFGLQIPLLLNSLVVLLLVRFLFGCGEAGAYPNLARVVGSWFPFRERAFVQGAIWTSARLGGAVAPFVIGKLTGWFGWREAFWVLGGVGVVWVFFFYRRFRNTPEEKPTVNAAERELIREGPGSWGIEQAAAGHVRPPWRRMLYHGSVWAMCVASFSVCFGWYFYPTWQPQYLEDEFKISFKDSEIMTGLPFLFGAAGCLIGGRLSDVLIRRTGSRRWGRSLVGFFGFMGAGLCFLATTQARTDWQAVTLLSLSFFLQDMAIPTIWAVCTDIGGRFAGTVSGVMNTAGCVGAILCPVVLPALRDQGYSWASILAILSVFWFIAATAWLFIDASRPVDAEPVV